MKRRDACRTAMTAVLCGAFLLLGAAGCAGRETDGRPAVVGNKDAYTAAVVSELTGYRLETRRSDTARNLFSAVSGGNLVECLNVQAIPAIRYDIAKYFFPQCLATVVLAVDRGQTDYIPSGWLDLLSSDTVIGFPMENTGKRPALAAIAYALDGENYTKASALGFIKKLNDKGIFSYGGENCPITVCFDYQAVQMHRDGRAIEIVVPKEGTLSFTLGLLSDNPIEAVSEGALLEAGLRLINGKSADPLYPRPEEYRSAREVNDLERFEDATKNIARDIRRSALRTHLFTSADGREHILSFIAAIVLILFWAAGALHRSPRSDVRRWIFMLSGLCVGWILLSLFKIWLPLNFLSRLCWYAYYIFLLGLPLAMLYIAAVIDRPAESQKPPKWFLVFAAFCPVLMLLLFTNDWHRLVFRFDLSGNWIDEYTYAAGYFLIFAYCAAAFLLSVIMLIVKSRKSPKRYACIGPILVAVLLIAYNAGYALGVPIFRHSNLTLLFCLLTVLFSESMLGAGMIPTNTHYMDLFSASPLNMQLLDKNGNTSLISANAAEPNPEQKAAILSAPGICLATDEDTLLHSRVIRGGIAVWQEDISALNRLRKKTEASVRKMQAANTLLCQEGEVRKQKIASDVKARLFALMEKDIAEETASLSKAVQNLPESGSGRERRISYITLLLCHIKRRCNLFFVAQEGGYVPGAELAVYLDELSEFASYAGIRALVRSRDLGDIDVKAATLCYDFYFSVLSWAIQDSRATLICQFGIQGGTLRFDVLSSESTKSLRFSDTLRRAADSLHAGIVSRALEESDGIYLICPRERGRE